jgi:hypothetical protein
MDWVFGHLHQLSNPKRGHLHYLGVRAALELGVSAGAVERTEQAS